MLFENNNESHIDETYIYPGNDPSDAWKRQMLKD